MQTKLILICGHSTTLTDNSKNARMQTYTSYGCPECGVVRDVFRAEPV